LTATGQALGRAVGWAVAPIFGFVSLVRHARTFHPRGPTLHATVSRQPGAPLSLAPLANRLLGPALVRFSGALWKRSEQRPDVLGCAIRLRSTPSATAAPATGDQDLLFATILRPWTMPFAPLTTDVHDYLANDYYAVSPFDVGLEHPVYLRLHPTQPSSQRTGTRDARLTHRIEHKAASLNLELSPRPFGPWAPVVRITLDRIAPIDGEALRFRPFRQGRDVHPRGFIHAMRIGVYRLSQLARPKRESA
jgi:hypothetical protein